MILADENIDAHMVDVLRLAKIKVYSIKEGHLGISDQAVIELSKNPPRIILTEDKDFGEWVYAHQTKEISVILLRYRPHEIELVTAILVDLITSRGVDLFGKFTTVTPTKIRIRSLK